MLVITYLRNPPNQHILRGKQLSSYAVWHVLPH